MQKRLYRSRDNRMVAGVCGGLGDYTQIDPTVIRVIFVILLLISFGTWLLIYLIAAILMPPEPLESAQGADEPVTTAMPEMEPAVEKVAKIESDAQGELEDVES